VTAETARTAVVRRRGSGDTMGLIAAVQYGSTWRDAPDAATGAPGTVAEERDGRARRQQFENEALLHLDALYSFALKLTRSRDEAEDLVSDTIVRAFDRWEQYHLGTNIRAWLFTILYHAFVSRKRRVEAREVQLPDDIDAWSAYEMVGDADPEGRFYDSFLDEEITRAIDALPEEYRSVVVLSDVQGLRYAEIAEILGIPEGTVKSRLFRGRRILQRKLIGYATDMGYLKLPSRASASGGGEPPSLDSRT
jgi:RNA polymerase sigma-70 factor (ECF subfamily)